MSSQGGSGDTTATYVIKTADAKLVNAQVLSGLASGYVKVTTATGVLSSQATPIPIADGGSGASSVAAGLVKSDGTVLSNVANSVVSANGMPTFASGSIGASDPFTLTQTWNAGGVTFDGILFTLTNTASAAASKAFAINVAGGTACVQWRPTQGLILDDGSRNIVVSNRQTVASVAGLANVAIGEGADCSGGGNSKVVVGPSAKNNSASSGGVAVGSSTNSNSANDVCIGASATNNTAASAIAIGTSANNTTAASSIAIGASATNNTFAGAISLGAGATTTRANQFMLGSTGTPISDMRVRPTSGVTAGIPYIFFTSTADAAVANSSVEATVVGTGVGTQTLPTNFLLAGRTVRITVYGKYGTKAAAGGNITVAVKFGSTVIATTGSQAPVANQTNQMFKVEVYVTCRTTGAGGTVSAQGATTLDAGLVPSMLGMVNTTTVSVDTTATQLVDCTATWVTADPANTITGTNCVIEVLN